jgi:hypothetical protein
MSEGKGFYILQEWGSGEIDPPQCGEKIPERTHDNGLLTPDGHFHPKMSENQYKRLDLTAAKCGSVVTC